MTTTEQTLTGEHTELLEALDKHRHFLRYTVQGLTDEQAALTPTASQLCLGGLIKHVTRAESGWYDFAVAGPEAHSGQDIEGHIASFRMEPGETLAGLLAAYEEAARRTDELVASGVDLDKSWPLPEAPWFKPGASWSIRRVLMHVIAETAQHAGHADIIRETIDGQKSMG
ncbi:DinB family protein [Kutzneria kofuensis]|uniref:Putative damage-inducible protein DinB n=1 Tax=Kutzneria kofuensis TaxID=103725 RepID=A0A7W9NGX5_9PSEU|nr:DinB family protein [Kutzneria kofuensis]MBB5892014.1 putative damage-inducible protein DinB [Kutzneria kofuensis]